MIMSNYLIYLNEYGKEQADKSFEELKEEDIENIVDFMTKHGYRRIVQVEDDSKIDFDRYPVFGLPCSTVTAVFEKGPFQLMENRK